MNNLFRKFAPRVGVSVLTVMLAVGFLVTGCAKEAQTKTAVGNEFVVEKLFTHEGCTVFRFSDAGSFRYFTNCRSEVSWQESCGKNCSRAMSIPTDDR